MGKTYYFWDMSKDTSIRSAWLFAREVKKRFGRNYRVWKPLEGLKDGSWSTWVDVCGNASTEIDKLANECITYTRNNAGGKK